jgi:hypothetical protein
MDRRASERGNVDQRSLPPLSRASVIAIAATLLCGLFIFVACHNVEGIFFLYPDVSTRYARGYSEEGFDAVTNDMPGSQVERMLGAPLWKALKPNGTEEWGYSQDNDPSFGDYAWFVRTIVVSNNIVVGVVKQVGYD